ncbi:MAG: hypothetical protein KIS96_11460 [Bauldia sp.]|nr:hypothetical protein [Bauldia sp.]
MIPTPDTADLPFLPPAETLTPEQIERNMARSARIEAVARKLDPEAFDLLPSGAFAVDTGWQHRATSAAELRFRRAIDDAIAAARREAQIARRDAATRFAEHLLNTGAVRP